MTIFPYLGNVEQQVSRTSQSLDMFSMDNLTQRMDMLTQLTLLHIQDIKEQNVKQQLGIDEQKQEIMELRDFVKTENRNIQENIDFINENLSLR